MKIVSDPLPSGLLDDVTGSLNGLSGSDYAFSVDLDDAAAVDAQIEFLLGYVNTLRKFTGRTELTKGGTGNVKKRSPKKPAGPSAGPPPVPTTFPPSAIAGAPEDDPAPVTTTNTTN